MGMDQQAFYVEEGYMWRHRQPFGYWRKNGWLDDWMTSLRRERENEDDLFEWIELKKEDVERLGKEIEAGQLARKSIEKEYYDSFMEKDLKFVEDALEHLKNGSRIFYLASY